jgi:hypothetical protein
LLHDLDVKPVIGTAVVADHGNTNRTAIMLVRDPDTTTQRAPQDHQLMPKHRILGFKPQPRLERGGEDGQRETEKPDHPAGLGDFVTSSTRTRLSVRTADRCNNKPAWAAMSCRCAKAFRSVWRDRDTG